MAFYIEVPDLYPWILLCAVILSIECLVIGYAMVVPMRMKHFPTGKGKFMQQFKYEHQAAFGLEARPAIGGFPDTGNGYYADKLPYKSWLEFNNAMRTHQNFVEWLPTILCTLLICGVYVPTASLVVGVVNCVTRPLYTMCYANKGPAARILPFIGGTVPIFGLLAYTVCYGLWAA